MLLLAPRPIAITLFLSKDKSQVKLKTAASGVGLATMGATLSIMLCSSGIG
jgi:hypothetical protein